MLRCRSNNEFTWEFNRYGQTDDEDDDVDDDDTLYILIFSHRTTAAAAIKSNMDPRYDDGSVLDMSNPSTIHRRIVIQGVRADIENCARHIMFAIGAESRYHAKYFVHCIELLEERIVTYHYGFKGAWFSCFVQVGRRWTLLGRYDSFFGSSINPAARLSCSSCSFKSSDVCLICPIKILFLIFPTMLIL